MEEDFGAVSFSTSSSLRRRAIHRNQTTNPNESFSNNDTGISQSKALIQSKSETKTYKYRHNLSVALVLVPSLLSLYASANDDESILFIVTIYVFLVIYTLDLIVWRDAYILGIWVGFAIIALTLLYATFVQEYFCQCWLTGIVKAICEIVLLFCATCWGLLQVEWLHEELEEYTLFLENSLHKLVSPISAAIMTHSFLHHFTWIEYELDHDFKNEDAGGVVWVLTAHAPLWVWKVCPFVFCSWFAWSMIHIAPASSSFQKEAKEKDDDAKLDGRKNSRELEPEDGGDLRGIRSIKRLSRILTHEDGQALSYAFMTLPLSLYSWTVLKGCITEFSVMDFILALTIPYLVHQSLVFYQYIWWRRGALSQTSIVLPGGKKIHSPLSIELLSAALTLVSIQCRYLYPISVSLTFAIHGGSDQSFALTSWQIHICLTSGLIGMTLSLRQLVKSNEDDWEQGASVLDTYYEEILLVAWIGSGFLFGIAMGIPWNDVLALLTATISVVSFFITQRLRFLVLFLIMVGAELFRLIINRFALVERTFNLVPGLVTISMSQLSVLVVLQGLTCFLLYGMVKKRSNGPLGGKIKHLDITGIVMFFQTVLLSLLEAALLFEHHDNIGTSLPLGGIHDLDSIYPPLFVFITSLLCLGLSWRLKQNHFVGDLNSLPTIALACSKLVSLIVDLNAGGNENATTQHRDYLVIMMSTWLLLCVVAVPCYIYSIPVRPQLTGTFNQRNKRSRSGRKIPKEVETFVMIYCGIVLPFATCIFVAQLLWPMLNLIISDESENYYDISILPSEFVGYSLSFWGLCTLSVLSNILPFGGGEGWRKASTSAILMGLCTLLVTPTSVVVRDDSSIFASISSIMSTKEGSKGGWGFIIAASSVLLALAGPLDLRDRKNKNYKRRLSIFFTIFNSGVSWMFTMQLLGEASFFDRCIILLASLVISLISAGLSVLFCTMDIRHFGKVQRKTRIGILGYIGVLLLVIMLLKGAGSELAAFGRGGWFGTLFFIYGLSILLLSVALRFRNKKVEEHEIGDLRNQCCFASWLLFLIMISCSFRLSESPPWILLASLTLWNLHHKGSKYEHKARYRGRLENAIELSVFSKSDNTLARFVIPCLLSTGMVYIVTTFYCIFLRGFSISLGDDSLVNMQHKSKAIHHDQVLLLTQSFLSHDETIASSAKLAAAGIWTSNNLLGPSLHILGFLAILPTWYFLFMTTKKQNSFNVGTLLPLNIFTLFVSKGIPSLTAAVWLGLILASQRWFDSKRIQKKGKISH